VFIVCVVTVRPGEWCPVIPEWCGGPCGDVCCPVFVLVVLGQEACFVLKSVVYGFFKAFMLFW